METKPKPTFDEQIGKIAETVIRAISVLIWLILIVITYTLKPIYWTFKKIKR